MGRCPFNAALCNAVYNSHMTRQRNIYLQPKIATAHGPTSPSLSSISGIAPHSSTTSAREETNGVQTRGAEHEDTEKHVRHFTTSNHPLLAAACSAVRPVLGDASFASSNGSTSSARTAFLNSVWTRLRSPEAAAACNASSWAGDGWLFDGAREAFTRGSGVGVLARCGVGSATGG